MLCNNDELSVEQQSKGGIDIECADGCTRKCFPVISGFMADYEEQTLLTGVKSGQPCTICTVPPRECDKLHLQWPEQTHQYMQEAIERIHLGELGEAEMAIHDVENFAWYHTNTNIHTAIMVDPLHQLLKGIAESTVGWTITHLKHTITTNKRKRGEDDQRSMSERSTISIVLSPCLVSFV